MKARMAMLPTVLVLVLAVAPFELKVLAHDRGDSQDDGKVKNEITRNCQLTAGARVEIYSINGPIEIETTAGSETEIHITRTSSSQRYLDRARKVLIDCSPSDLQIHEEKSGSEDHVKTHVMLKVPARIDLSLHEINGAVNAANVEGRVNMNSVNGRVQIGQAVESSAISNINGKVTISLVRPGLQGLHISEINGTIELHFSATVNAELDVRGVNGGVYTDLPNVTVQGKLSSRNFHARVGTGGPAISVSEVNGKVHITGISGM
jgi:hypothetical protein